ncbi:hypothetical protein CYY_006638 [Polysphondylium violaceum]|uniref:Uncharacterized protein n=1 Tax=Polysphondylium violaceum TaxID=133409 RepID=A0A8J4PQA3_9MYCE|nr:hypothetical protein CYY_006638 [Polysphondylium violaceum]
MSLFPLLRSLSSLMVLTTKDIRTGSASWYFGIFGTTFLSTEWIMISCFWFRLLYTFFLSSNKIVMENIKRTWISSITVAILLTIWPILLCIVINVKGVKLTRDVSSKGFICLVALIGTIILVNAFILIRCLRKQAKKSPRFQSTVRRTTKLALVLLVFFLGLILRDVIIAAIKMPIDSNSRYITMFITFLLEFGQCFVVMVALGGKSSLNYITFARVIPDNQSGSASGAESKDGMNSNIKEISLSAMVDPEKSSKRTVSSITISVDNNNLNRNDSYNSGFTKTNSLILENNSRTSSGIYQHSTENILNNSTVVLLPDNNEEQQQQ